NLFNLDTHVLDLGSSPGGWSQYASSKIGNKGRIVACDILPMSPIIGVDFFQGDLRKKNTLNALLKYLENTKCHVVMSDMSPNITGHASIDIPNSIYLCHLALIFAKKILYKNGFFLFKSFQGEGFNEFYKEIKIFFSQVKICKPKTSRTRSREIFILATK
ncbi:rRNA methyltransferase, partial [Buchnera aphidicola]|nr:rRNA methyltransferase [Buchnera aphidicola]